MINHTTTTFPCIAYAVTHGRVAKGFPPLKMVLRGWGSSSVSGRPIVAESAKGNIYLLSELFPTIDAAAEECIYMARSNHRAAARQYEKRSKAARDAIAAANQMLLDEKKCAGN